MRFLVLGAGALGGYFGGMPERHGVEVPILRAALCNLQIAEAIRRPPSAPS
jgi:ketopantoate reductase